MDMQSRADAEDYINIHIDHLALEFDTLAACTDDEAADKIIVHAIEETYRSLLNQMTRSTSLARVENFLYSIFTVINEVRGEFPNPNFDTMLMSKHVANSNS